MGEQHEIVDKFFCEIVQVLRSHFHQNLKPDPLPTKIICLQSHAALTLINFLFLHIPHHLI